MAKSTPYPPCTGTIFRLKNQDTARCCRRVTQPPFIAGPLGVKTLAHNKFSFIKIYLDNKLSSTYQDFAT